jgi:maltose O-acetyltransferase
VSLRESLFLTLANHLPRSAWSDRHRWRILRLAGVRIEAAEVWGPVTIRPLGGAHNLTIHANAFVNTGLRVGCPSASVTIGRGVLIGPRVSLETVSHSVTVTPGRGRTTESAPIIIEDDAWIGAGAIITGGITIGRGAVVAAGAVVTHDVPPLTLVAGVPARPVRSIEPHPHAGAAP